MEGIPQAQAFDMVSGQALQEVEGVLVKAGVNRGLFGGRELVGSGNGRGVRVVARGAIAHQSEDISGEGRIVLSQRIWLDPAPTTQSCAAGVDPLPTCLTSLPV